MHYASLNYRDLIIPHNKYPFPTADPVVPLSDGAGVVVAVGSEVKEWVVGDRVMPIFNQGHQAGDVKMRDVVETGVGGKLDGVAREWGVWGEDVVVRVPDSLSLKEASTLPCAALTAWNALYGLSSRALKPGDWVLTQGTGGVSLFAVQFAKLAGARVISTTSSDSKADLLRSLGASHILNYNSNPQWGEAAKDLTPGKVGVDHVLEVAGPRSMAQSLKAVKPEGVVSIIGFLGGVKGKEGDEKQPGFLECLNRLCTVRGILVGSKAQFEEMCRAIDAGGIKPVVDEKEWGFGQLREAYEYMWKGGHVGKVVVKVSEGEEEGKGAKL